MSQPGTREELYQEYFALQEKAQDYVTKNTTRDKHMSQLMDSVKKLATPREAYGQMNLAQVVLNTRAMNRIISQIQSNPTKLKPTTRSLTQPQIGGAPFNVEICEKLTEPEDMNAQTANYLLTMAESQAIESELETLATAVQNGKVSDSDLFTYCYYKT